MRTGPPAVSDRDEANVQSAVDAVFGHGAFERINREGDSDAALDDAPSGGSPTDGRQDAAASSITGPWERVLAARRAPLAGATVVLFEVAGALYALPIANVVEVRRLPLVTRIPNVPESVRGLTSLRGTILAAVDARRLLGASLGNRPQSQFIIVVRSFERDATTGLIVDSVLGVRGVTSPPVNPAEPDDPQASPVVQGRADWDGRMVAVLHSERLFAATAQNHESSVDSREPSL